MIDWASIGAAIGIPLLRSFGGWAVKATKDNKITKFELKELLGTVVKTGVIAVMIYFGADGFGIDVNAVGCAASAVVLDMVLGSVKETKNVTNRG